MISIIRASIIMKRNGSFDYFYVKEKINQFSQYLAVSSPARPWIDLFYPKTSNMAVTESDPDPKVRKMSITLY